MEMLLFLGTQLDPGDGPSLRLGGRGMELLLFMDTQLNPGDVAL